MSIAFCQCLCLLKWSYSCLVLLYSFGDSIGFPMLKQLTLLKLNNPWLFCTVNFYEEWPVLCLFLLFWEDVSKCPFTSERALVKTKKKCLLRPSLANPSVYWEHSQEDEWLEDSYIRLWWGLTKAASLELQKNLQVILPAEDLPFKHLFTLLFLTLGECESYNFPCWISLVFWVFKILPLPTGGNIFIWRK